MIKAIETHYKGYRFRSRLEARWAVFFDALGIKWEYEKEGFDFDGTYYLPDFWLPTYQLWVEIKPESVSSEELRKCGVITFGNKQSVCVLIGTPWPSEYKGLLIEPVESPDGKPYTLLSFTELVRCRRCNALNWLDGEEGFGSFGGCCDTEKWPVPAYDGLLLKAYKAARSARFEHGENG